MVEAVSGPSVRVRAARDMVPAGIELPATMPSRMATTANQDESLPARMALSGGQTIVYVVSAKPVEKPQNACHANGRRRKATVNKKFVKRENAQQRRTRKAAPVCRGLHRRKLQRKQPDPWRSRRLREDAAHHRTRRGDRHEPCRRYQGAVGKREPQLCDHHAGHERAGTRPADLGVGGRLRTSEPRKEVVDASPDTASADKPATTHSLGWPPAKPVPGQHAPVRGGSSHFAVWTAGSPGSPCGRGALSNTAGDALLRWCPVALNTGSLYIIDLAGEQAGQSESCHTAFPLDGWSQPQCQRDWTRS